MAQKRLRGENNRKAHVWNKTAGHCHLCGERMTFDGKWEIDHLLPRDAGGTNDEWNLLPICRFCNGMKKAAKTYRMRRVLMYGRYCLDKAMERAISADGATIYEIVRRRVKSVMGRAKTKPPHVQLWKQTPKKQK